MQQWRLATMAIIVLGGIAVLGSYIHGATTAPGKASALWGGVPKALLPAYTVAMFLAAAGFLLYTYFLMFRLEPAVVRFGFGLDFRVVPLVYLLVLIPSALWMSLTIAMVDAPSPAIWAAIRLVLFAVGFGALAVLVLLLTAQPRQAGAAYWAAVVGAAMFFIHTGILDALLWPYYFPR